MNKTLSELTGLYPLSKTLRFELRPCLMENQNLEQFWDEYINSSWFINDEKRWNARNTTKFVFDEFHKALIAEALKSFSPKKGSWNKLYNLYNLDKNGDDYSKEQAKLRDEIATSLTSCNYYKYVKSYPKLIEAIIAEENKEPFVDEIVERVSCIIGKDSQYVVDSVKGFYGFATGYFSNYKENRDNMYKATDDATSIANRIVNENFPKFADNIIVYNRLKENCIKELHEIENNLLEKHEGRSLDGIFTPDAFSSFITQEGIDTYNWFVGGDPNSNVEGINKVGNEYLHKNPESKLRLKDLTMTKLYKQILSDRVRLAFIPEQFQRGPEGERELLEAVELYFAHLPQLISRYSQIVEQLSTGEVNLSKVYVVGKNLTKLSMLLYGDWDILGRLLRENLVVGNSAKANAEKTMEVSEWAEKRAFPLSEIIKASEKIIAPDSTGILELMTGLKYKKPYKGKVVEIDLVKTLNSSYVVKFLALKQNVLDGGTLSNSDEAKASMKIFMDAMMDVLHVVELLRLGKKSATLNKDSFYTEYDSLFEHSSDSDVVFSDLIALYNKVRSFLTRKVCDDGKMLLKFDYNQLAEGWDANKEKDCKSIILRKGGQYFFGIITDSSNSLLKDSMTVCNEPCYEKMVYKQFDITKGLPKCTTELKAVKKALVDERKNEVKVFEKKTWRKPIIISRHLWELNNYVWDKSSNEFVLRKKSGETRPKKFQKKYLEVTGDKLGYSRALCDWIDFCKEFLSSYKSTECYSYEFKETKEYESVDEFYSYLDGVHYNISFVNYSESYIQDLIRGKKLLLFEIANKDFNLGSTGTPNLHTLYWRYLFSAENKLNTIYKLNGGAELFFRRKLEGNSITHHKGSMIVNKRFADGKPIPTELYREFYNFYNKKDVVLSEEAKRLLPNVLAKEARFDIQKDRRYFQHHFEIHIPITLNFKNKGIKTAGFNNFMLDYLRRHKEEINIIGIDRGERNLIYVSVINQKGENIIPPQSYNVIDTVSYDGIVRQFHYLEKLKQVERNKADAYQHWGKIENIKEIKSGLMAQVVHEITKLVVKHHAIVVLEDLNYGFKRGRFNVERQVYQLFEKRLIEKLNFLAFKIEAPSSEYGNVWNALQLTAPFSSFKELGKQSGWLFYVPAAYTSKIDPLTGFANLFDMKRAEANPKDFLSKFDDISFKDGLLHFRFDYRKFDVVQTDCKNEWVITSKGERIYRTRIPNTNHFESVPKDLSTEFLTVLGNYEINTNDLSVEKLQMIDDERFFKEFFFQFKMMLQMRNSNSEQDYIISPVQSSTPFDTNCENELGIEDADANGAYNIALKGLYLVHNNFPMEDNHLKRITHSEWFSFIQQKPYLK